MSARQDDSGAALQAPAQDPRWEAIESAIRRPSAATGPEVMLVAAHPDDEIIGAGALLRRLSSKNVRVRIVHATDGAPANGRDAAAHGFASVEAYRRARRVELHAALRAMEIRCDLLASIAIRDQEAASSLAALTRAVAHLLRRHPVDVVLSHPFEGGHPDHDACAFAVHAAAHLVRRDTTPLLVEFASYHAGAEGIRRGLFPEGGPDAVRLTLTEQEQRHKALARDCFVSQRETLAPFGLHEERFRPAPRYRFDQRPAHRLLYEQFDWGTDARLWRSAAASALAELGLPSHARL